MNLSSLVRRVATAATASAAFALLVTGTASANTPIRIVAEAESSFTVHDDEWLTPERRKWNLAGTTFGTLGSGNATFSSKISRCHGDEVRGELFVSGHRWSWSEAATVSVHMDLYEGTSCSTTDLDGQSPIHSFTIKLGEVKKLYLSADNTAENAHDYVAAWVIFKAVPA